jgi:hypothetical protein
MTDSLRSDTRRSLWRPRLTIGALMLMVAMVALWLAWQAERARRVAVVDVGPPDLVAVGDRQHTLASLRARIQRSGVQEVIIRCPTNMPFNSLIRVVDSIKAAGVHEIAFSQQIGPLNPALQRRPSGKLKHFNAPLRTRTGS